MKLAIEGGQPVRSTLLPYGQQWIDEKDIENVLNTLKSPFITQGPAIEKFENAVANYVGAKYAVAFVNGTAALHGACFAAGVSEGDEVITTPITFAASANCALYLGARPVFADIDDRTYNIDANSIEKVISKKTKAIIPVDFTGQPVDMDRIREIAKKNNLVIIEDAAHSLGATYKNKKVGTLADMTMFSFHPVKQITTGEGGIIVTDREDYAEKLRLFRSHGITRDINHSDNEGAWYYEMRELGYNYRMTDLQASLGTSQLNKIERFVRRRKEIAKKYQTAFSSIKEIITPHQLEETESSWHLYILRLSMDLLKVNRKRIFDALRAENIGVNVHYVPVHYHPYYKKLGYSKGICPIAEHWYEEVLTLPLFPKMTDDDINSVINAVIKVINHYKQ